MNRPTDHADRPRPAEQSAEGDFWDDEWNDETWTDPPERSGRRDLVIVVGIVAAILVIGLVLVTTSKRPTDRGEGTGTGAAPAEARAKKDKGGFCDDWPAALGGDGAGVSRAPGTSIWSDFGGIHLRANVDKPIRVTLTANAPYTVTRRGSGVTASADSGPALTFDLPAGHGETGPDLNVPCTATGLRLEVLQDGLPVPPEAIHVGGSSTAAANPASFLRTPG